MAGAFHPEVQLAVHDDDDGNNARRTGFATDSFTLQDSAATTAGGGQIPHQESAPNVVDILTKLSEERAAKAIRLSKLGWNKE